MKKRQDLSAAEVEELYLRLQRRLEGLGVPSLPHVAMRVLELTQDPGSSFRDFAEVVRTDQALTGRLLRMANSAFFAQAKEVTSIERAMLLIGLQRLKALVLGFHLSEVVDKQGGDGLKRVWTESIFRGWLAHGLAERVYPDLRGEAFIVGLMSDAGLPLMSKLLAGKYAAVMPKDAGPAQRYSIELHTLPFTHIDVSFAMCRMWNFPKILARPIQSHHQPTVGALDNGHPDEVLQAIAYYVNGLDLGDHVELDDAGIPPRSTQAFLRMSPQETREVLDEASNGFAASREIFAKIIDNKVKPAALLQRANDQLVRKLEEMMIEGQAADPSPPQVSMMAGGLHYEFRLVGPKRLHVLILDSGGSPLLEDEIVGGERSDDELRRSLLLGEATAEEVAGVAAMVRQLAA